jgi:hypothetical protein
MGTVGRLGALALGLVLAGCSEDRSALAPELDSPAMAQDHSSGVVVQVKGTADHVRTVGDVTALTLFSFDSERKADGTTTGSYFYNFQAAGFSVEGPVTCISVAGNQAWIGGTVARIDTPDPELQELLGVDMWWRSIDNGNGVNAAPDSTTGLGFAFPGSTITAESWCRDQPAVLILREIGPGSDLKVKVK